MIAEILRKFIHISSLWIPLLYYYYSKDMMLQILLIVTLIYLLCDYNKARFIFLKNTFSNFSFVMRSQEIAGKLTGASYMLLACCLTIFLFSKENAIISLLILVISDTNAAIFGKMIKSRKICGDKTIIGSLAFFITSSLIIVYCYFWFNLSIIYLYYGVPIALIITYIELKSIDWKIDDNFSIPLSTGLLLTLIDIIYAI